MFTKTQSGSMPRLLTALLAGALLFSACSPAASTPGLPNPIETSAQPVTLEPTAIPPATLEPTALPPATETMPPAATVAPTQAAAPLFTMDAGSLASGFQTEIIPAASTADNGPYWELLPEYPRVTLQGYPISGHLFKPQLFIYPVAELVKTNEGAGKIVEALQSLLKSPQETEHMPFLPLLNASQVMHVQTQFLDFKNGQGVRYLVEFDQAPLPVNNSELVYTYQGLTSDGKYYVAAVLPVNHPSLPADGMVTGNEPPEFKSDFPAYLASVVAALNTQAANTFSPDLTQLDAMLSSLEIK